MDVQDLAIQEFTHEWHDILNGSMITQKIVAIVRIEFTGGETGEYMRIKRLVHFNGI